MYFGLPLPPFVVTDEGCITSRASLSLLQRGLRRVLNNLTHSKKPTLTGGFFVEPFPKNRFGPRFEASRNETLSMSSSLVIQSHPPCLLCGSETQALER